MKNILGRIIAAIMLCSTFAVIADEPAGYYTTLNGKKDSELKTAIFNLVRNFTTVSSYSNLPQYFRRTDVYPEGDEKYGQWWDMYGNIPLYLPSFTGMNREHSFPKSWWGGSTSTTAYVDLNHLYPSEAAANMAKSNYPLGEVSINDTPKYANGISTVGYPANGQGGGAPYVFEPDDDYKGDFARTYFYMVTYYLNLSWATKYMYMLEQNAYPTLKPWAINLLLKWHRDDPVSQKEIDRNNTVYTIQNNRNPFIDRPDLVEYIWGNKVGQTYNGASTDPAGDPVLITPVQDMALEFGQLAIGQTLTLELFFRGEHLTGNLEVQIYRGDTGMFSIPVRTISSQLVNQANGTVLKVTYKPTEIGQHTARLLVSGGGVSGSLGVQLIGECLDVPTMTACTALPASDITADSYRANWTSPKGEVVDYWVVNRTIYVNGQVSAETLQAEDTSLIIEGFNESDKETYTVQSVRLGYMSPESNVIFVDHSGITGVTVDEPLIVQGFNGFMRFICSSEQTGARVYDVSGKPVMHIDKVYQNLDVEIPAGVYFVTTERCAAPVKVIVR